MSITLLTALWRQPRPTTETTALPSEWDDYLTGWRRNVTLTDGSVVGRYTHLMRRQNERGQFEYRRPNKEEFSEWQSFKQW